VAGVALMEVACLHEEIERALAAAGLDAGDAFHLGRRFEVLVVLGLVDKDMVHTKFIKNEAVILLVLGEQVLESFLTGRLLLLDGLDEVAVRPGCIPAGAFAE